jgi:hypothetical protein
VRYMHVMHLHCWATRWVWTSHAPICLELLTDMLHVRCFQSWLASRRKDADHRLSQVIISCLVSCRRGLVPVQGVMRRLVSHTCNSPHYRRMLTWTSPCWQLQRVHLSSLPSLGETVKGCSCACAHCASPVE